ncbi:MAG: VWA domain-containing protein, partial [bacterium]
LAAAAKKGIVVNAIQSGQHDYTRPAWQNIAALGKGEYFQVEDSGSAVAVTTPFDEEISALATKLEDTRLYFGDKITRKAQQAKLDANLKLREELSKQAQARRAAYNATASGSKNFLGESELVDAVTKGKIGLEQIAKDDLPASLQAMAPQEQMDVINTQAQRRSDLKQKIKKLSESRSRYINQKVEAAGGADDSLDERIYRAVKSQSASVGLSYDRDHASY